MKILSLGLDNSVLDQNSPLAGRLIGYGDLVDEYAVIVPSAKSERFELSAKVIARGSGGGNKLTRLLKIYGLAKNLLAGGGYDLITVQDQYYLALIGLVLSKKFRIGLEIQAHGFEKCSGLRKIMANYVLPRADAIRCVSQRLKKELVNKFGVAENIITVAPIYCQVRSKKLEVKSGEKKGKFVFLTVGRLVSVKNVALQIEAMREVKKRHPEAELWIIGDGPEKEKLEVRSKKLGLVDNIKLLGWKTDLSEYYSAADAFLLTSNSEGWGLAVIEAAAYGLPIIMTEVGCAGEVIKNSESGIVVPVGDKAKLAEAMIKFIEDENLRKKLGDQARLAVGSLPAKEQILDLYKKSWQKAKASILNKK